MEKEQDRELFTVTQHITQSPKTTRELESLVKFINKGFAGNNIPIRVSVSGVNNNFGNYAFCFFEMDESPSDQVWCKAEK